MIKIDLDLLENAKEKLKSQKEELEKRINYTVSQVNESEEMKSKIKSFLRDEYSKEIKQNELEIEVVTYIKDNLQEINKYLIYKEDCEVNIYE